MAELIALWSALLILITLVTYAAQRFSLPAPVLLVLAGLLISLLPFTPRVTLHPQLVLNAFLPLLIYTGAVTIPWHEFRRNLRPIGILSIGLVAFTACGVALLAHALLPGMPWAAAFVLGAVISPPDDVAVAVVTRRLPVPRRIVTILEGEGLINDVTALTLFRFALVAAAGGSVSATGISLVFLGALAGGIAYGLLVGWIALALRARMQDTQLEITLSLVTPFAAYLLPEHLGVTGILSVVAAGILVSAQSPRRIPAQTRLQVHRLWETVSFWLNSLLFLVLGLQLRTVAADASGVPLPRLIGYGALFSLLVIALRFVWVYPVARLTRVVFPSLRRTDPLPPSRHLFLVAYAGMRGAISMAAVLAIPLALPGGAPFPERGVIVFVTFFVVLVTLVGQGLFLPQVVRALGIDRDGLRERRRDRATALRARIAASDAGIACLDRLARDGRLPGNARDSLVREREIYRRGIARQLDGEDDAAARAVAAAAFDARRAEIGAEREALLAMLADGAIDDHVLVRIEHDLDLRESRLEDHALPPADERPSVPDA